MFIKILLFFILILIISLLITQKVIGGEPYMIKKVKKYDNVLAHVAGPSGVGKTTMAQRLQNKYPDVIFKDVDDFHNLVMQKNKILANRTSSDILRLYEQGTDLTKIWVDGFSDELVKFIKKNKNKKIILFGYVDNFLGEVDIPAKHKFLLFTDIATVMKQRYFRNPAPAEEILEWPEQIANDIVYYQKKGYETIRDSEPIEKLLKSNK